MNVYNNSSNNSLCIRYTEATWLSPGRVRAGSADTGLLNPWTAVVRGRHRALRLTCT